MDPEEENCNLILAEDEILGPSSSMNGEGNQILESIWSCFLDG